MAEYPYSSRAYHGNSSSGARQYNPNVTDILGKHSDLMDEFKDFLERCENIDGFLSGVMNQKSLSTDAHLSRSSKLEDKDKDEKREMDGAKEKDRYKEKYMGKSIQELDLSDCKRCTPSYRLLPAEYHIPTASQGSELGAQVLNDHWVCVTSGSEDYSFKHMRKNQYEESLFRCEDDRFELDLLLESVSSASKRAEELYNNINENKISVEALSRIEDHFTVLNSGCNERLYGDNGLDVIDILRKNPTHALPVILTRLKQKQAEWSRFRSDFNKVWAEIYAKNHYKSLDDRSFYFKQQDSKNLSTKSLVAEIKEIKERLLKEDHIIQSIAAETRQPLISHLEFEYSDGGIHEDLYKLVRYSCEEVFSSKELLNKIMRLWSTFLEPMLGVTSQSHGTERVEDRKAGHSSRNFAASNVGGHGSPHTDSISTNSRLPKSDKNEGNGRVTEVKNIHWTSVASNDKENGSVGGELVCRDDQLMDKGLKKVECSDKASGFSKQFASDEQGVKNNPSIAIRGENSLNRTNLDVSPGCESAPSRATDADDSVAKSQTVNLPLVEGGDIAAPVPVANGVLVENSEVKSHEESSGPCKVEKEEGELSPNGDSEEDNFVAYGDSNAQSMAKSKHNIERRKYESRDRDEECGPETGGDNDADADDEDSENVSEAGEDVSGSESAGDECFQEDHEEDDIEHDDVDGKAESEGEAEGMCDDAQGGGDGSSLPLSERFLLSVNPLTKHVSAVSFAEEKKDSRVFCGNDDFYVLFMLHQILYERILSAKTNSMSAEMKWKAKDASSPDPYSRFMNALYNLLDGSAENSKFEDECRAITGNRSYVLFTLDKLIYKLIRQLQTVATDDEDSKLLQLYEYEKSRKPGKLNDSVYHANAHVILHEENIYRFQCSSTPPRLSIQLMDYMNEMPELSAVSIDPNFSFYLHNDFLSVLPSKKEPHCILLQRNKGKYGKLDDLSAICSAMEGVKVINGLECKIVCNSSKGCGIAAPVPVANGVLVEKIKVKSHVESSGPFKIEKEVGELSLNGPCKFHHISYVPQLQVMSRQLLGFFIPFFFVRPCYGEGELHRLQLPSSLVLVIVIVLTIVVIGIVVLRDLTLPIDPMPPIISNLKKVELERIGTLYEQIAVGRSGTIYRGSFGRRNAAIKEIVDFSISDNEYLCFTMADNHPHIVRFFTREKTSNAHYMAMELGGCTLGDFIHYFSDMPIPAINDTALEFLNLINPILWWGMDPSPLLMRLMRQIVLGLSQLHRKHIVHRDLKPTSILIARDAPLCVKISGMSISTLLDPSQSVIGSNVAGRGSSGWQPAEVINGGPQTFAVDTFSLGCVLFFCMTGGYHPFGDGNLDKNIKNNYIDLSDVPPVAKHLISSLVQYRPSLRLKVDKVLLHPFFWETDKKLSFIRDVLEQLKNCAHSDRVLIDFEHLFRRTDWGTNWGTNWGFELPPLLFDYLLGDYTFTSPRNLLRAIRNLYIHHPTLPEHIQGVLGATPNDCYRFFDRIFPFFFIDVYTVISDHWSNRAEFDTYFRDNELGL